MRRRGFAGVAAGKDGKKKSEERRNEKRNISPPEKVNEISFLRSTRRLRAMSGWQMNKMSQFLSFYCFFCSKVTRGSSGRACTVRPSAPVTVVAVQREL